MPRSRHRSENDNKSKPGTWIRFDYERTAVDRFRESFRRARWNPDRREWFVPGKTAGQRIARWFDQERAHHDPFGDQRGRDAFEFEPIESPYLTADDDLLVRTPYSKELVALLRSVPWSNWDDGLRAWRIPFRSYEQLRNRWPKIEAAARSAEPEERKRRRQAEQNTPKAVKARLNTRERRKRRHPVLATSIPPLDRPVATTNWGIVKFEAVKGEIVDPEVLRTSYPKLAQTGLEYIWGQWRRATFAELVRTRPATPAQIARGRDRGWWEPTLEELRDARRQERAFERRRNDQTGKSSSRPASRVRNGT